MSYGTPGAPIAVGALNRITRELLENTFQQCWVRGELIALSIPSSGHWYFTLKDNEGQISCAFFKKYRTSHEIIPVGTEVLLCGTVTLYEPRGQYQMIVENIIPWGIGQRHIQFEALKKTLYEEGLLDSARKQLLPRFPRRIAIISSQQAAGLQDVLVILKRRYPLAHIIIYPSLVQGDSAPAELIRALDAVEKHAASLDVLMIVRGGGSPEDLWCFNDERLVRRIAAMSVPVITGIGHEIDTTLADLVADVRAPTPSAAAETVVMDIVDIMMTLQQWSGRINRLVGSRIEHLWLRIDSMRLRLVQPVVYMGMKSQKIIHLKHALQHAVRNALRVPLARSAMCRMQLLHLRPTRAMEQFLGNIRGVFHAGIEQYVMRRRSFLTESRHVLEARDPSHLLQGGWAWVEGDDGALKNITAMQPGSTWRLWVLGGTVDIEVKKNCPDTL